jgi:hypothetical protein
VCTRTRQRPPIPTKTHVWGGSIGRGLLQELLQPWRGRHVKAAPSSIKSGGSGGGCVLLLRRCGAVAVIVCGRAARMRIRILFVSFISTHRYKEAGLKKCSAGDTN